MTLDEEQRHYLAEGIRHRARYYGADLTPVDGHLVLALAWFAAYWKDQADRADARNRDRETGDLFEETDARQSATSGASRECRRT